MVSALTGEGLEGLTTAIEAAFARTLTSVELLLPYSEGGRLAELHDVAGDLHREDTPEGVRVVARLPVAVAERYARYSLNGRRG
jgi:GTP-binding protein HflX